MSSRPTSAKNSSLKVRIDSAGYGSQPVLRGVRLELIPGSIVTLLGANGSGKTTAVRALCGLIGFSGSVELDGEQIAGLAPQRIARKGILQVPEGRGTFASMSVLENLMIGAYLRSDRVAVKRDLEWIYSLFPRLQERSRQQAGSLSGGEQQMLAVSRALMGNPRYLVLDEPSLGLAPIVIRQLFGILGRIKNARGGIGILLVEQNARMALTISDHGYVLEGGTVRLSAPAGVLIRDADVVTAYLGT